MKALLASLFLVALVSSARAECPDDYVVISPPHPVPASYDWSPAAISFCTLAAACGPPEPACIASYLDAVANPTAGVYTPPSASTVTSASDGEHLACADSIDFADGEVACNACGAPGCDPQVQCGVDANGNHCGECGPNEQCVSGRCELQSCCGARTCGPDPCNPDASCGACDSPYACEDGTCTCTSITFPPSCGSYVDSCGQQHDAGLCDPGFECENGTCTCTDVFVGECGLDECGNYHGCFDGSTCYGGTCGGSGPPGGGEGCDYGGEGYGGGWECGWFGDDCYCD